MNIKQLQTFIAVVQRGSLSEAAYHLHFTQPAVSKHLQALERYYGTILIERGGRDLVLTEQGRILYQHGLEVLQLLEEAETAVLKSGDVIKGHLRLAASTIPGQYILPHYVGAFKKYYPQVDITLEVCSSEQVQKLLLSREVDFGAVGVKPKNQQINSFILGTDSLVLIAAPGFLEGKTSRLTMKELINYPIVLRKEGSGTKQVVEERLRNAGCNVEELNRIMELGNNESVKTAVEAGLGMAFVSHWAIQKELKLGTLVEVELEEMVQERQLFCICLEQKNQHRLLELWIAFVRKTRLEEIKSL